jgi:hypothetical protein
MWSAGRTSKILFGSTERAAKARAGAVLRAAGSRIIVPSFPISLNCSATKNLCYSLQIVIPSLSLNPDTRSSVD